MYKEIETLVEVLGDAEELERYLRTHFTFDEEVNFIDTYYYDPLRPELQDNERAGAKGSLRIRNRNGQKVLITHKIDQYDEQGLWLYSDEIEFEIGDELKAQELFKALGLKKHTSLYINTLFFIASDFEIALQRVKDLGIYLEVEYKKSDGISSDGDIRNVKKEIQKFIDLLPIKTSPEINAGKLKLALDKAKKKL